jgi:hypothetical protein
MNQEDLKDRKNIALHAVEFWEIDSITENSLIWPPKYSQWVTVELGGFILSVSTASVKYRFRDIWICLVNISLGFEKDHFLGFTEHFILGLYFS